MLSPRLKDFSNPEFKRGRPWFVEGIWIVLQALFVSSWIPGSFHRNWLLRLFGAQIGKGICIKPGLKVKFPWRLEIGDYTWIGEDVWIDNLAFVRIGSNCCVSQGVYLCTGSHDWSKETFDLITNPITLDDGVWVSAKAVIGPGVSLEEGSILTLGSVATAKKLDEWTVYQGSPAVPIKKRRMTEDKKK